ncbi:YetF domain-containing protein [Kaistella sp.]
MRKELLTKDELMTNLRENGIENLSDVKKAFVESEGNISFVKFKDKE